MNTITVVCISLSYQNVSSPLARKTDSSKHISLPQASWINKASSCLDNTCRCYPLARASHGCPCPGTDVTWCVGWYIVVWMSGSTFWVICVGNLRGLCPWARHSTLYFSTYSSAEAQVYPRISAAVETCQKENDCHRRTYKNKQIYCNCL